MTKFDQDELYLLVDFLEEQLDNQRHKECWGIGSRATRRISS